MIGVMAALNVEFTDEEMDLLRGRAAKYHVSMKSLVHDVAVRAAGDDTVADATGHVISISRDLLDRLAQQ
jgi:hypothetical protein